MKKIALKMFIKPPTSIKLWLTAMVCPLFLFMAALGVGLYNAKNANAAEPTRAPLVLVVIPSEKPTPPQNQVREDNIGSKTQLAGMSSSLYLPIPPNWTGSVGVNSVYPDSKKSKQEWDAGKGILWTDTIPMPEGLEQYKTPPSFETNSPSAKTALNTSAMNPLPKGLANAFTKKIPERPTVTDSADFVVVQKSLRQLTLMRGGQPIRTYKVALGFQPKGDKIQEGDGRTPEGLYRLDRRNENSRFYRSIRVSYPDTQDRIEALQAGFKPGGQIMVHGLPNGRNASDVNHPNADWTEGCIAVTNAEIDEIWDLVGDNTQILILP